MFDWLKAYNAEQRSGNLEEQTTTEGFSDHSGGGYAIGSPGTPASPHSPETIVSIGLVNLSHKE